MSKFSSLFTLPAIPEVIHGASDVALKNKGFIALVLGDGTTPEVRGQALLAAIAAAAFNGGSFSDLPVEAKGNKRLILAGMKAGALPACKGGAKAPRPLTSSEVEIFIAAMAASMGEVAPKKAPVARVPDVLKFVGKFGREQAHAFAVALLAATGGVVDLHATPPKKAAKLAA